VIQGHCCNEIELHCWNNDIQVIVASTLSKANVATTQSKTMVATVQVARSLLQQFKPSNCCNSEIQSHCCNNTIQGHCWYWGVYTKIRKIFIFLLHPFHITQMCLHRCF
jgi:hypothetical protein